MARVTDDHDLLILRDLGQVLGLPDLAVGDVDSSRYVALLVVFGAPDAQQEVAVIPTHDNVVVYVLNGNDGRVALRKGLVGSLGDLAELGYLRLLLAPTAGDRHQQGEHDQQTD